MKQDVKEAAERLIDFVLPFPGEKSWDELKVYLDMTDPGLHALLTEIDGDLPGLLYKSVDMHEQPVAVGVREEKKQALLEFVEVGGFS